MESPRSLLEARSPRESRDRGAGAHRSPRRRDEPAVIRPGGPRLTGTCVLLLAGILAACFPTNRPGVDDRGAEGARVSGSDTVRVILHNPNFLDANVRLYGDGAQVGRFFVGGHSTDTAYIRRWQLREALEISAVVEPIGSASAYRLGDYMLPEDATEIRIDISTIPRLDDG